MHDDGLILYRRDPTQNMARFYALAVSPSLFGGALLTRRWGRIGTHGAALLEHFEDTETARHAAARLECVKRRRGYA